MSWPFDVGTKNISVASKSMLKRHDSIADPKEAETDLEATCGTGAKLQTGNSIKNWGKVRQLKNVLNLQPKNYVPKGKPEFGPVDISTYSSR